MATALQSALKLTPAEFVETVRESAARVLEATVETAQATFDKKQKEGRLVLSKQVLKGAHRVNELSKVLVILSAKIAPAAPRAHSATRAPRAAAKSATKPIARKAAAKPRARKAA